MTALVADRTSSRCLAAVAQSGLSKASCHRQAGVRAENIARRGQDNPTCARTGCHRIGKRPRRERKRMELPSANEQDPNNRSLRYWTSACNHAPDRRRAGTCTTNVTCTQGNCPETRLKFAPARKQQTQTRGNGTGSNDIGTRCARRRAPCAKDGQCNKTTQQHLHLWSSGYDISLTR